MRAAAADDLLLPLEAHLVVRDGSVSIVDEAERCCCGATRSRRAARCAHARRRRSRERSAEESTMPTTRPPYPPEFKQRLVEQVHAGRTPEELAEKFEPTAQSIRNWVAQADRDAGHRADGLSTEEREELRRLRRENKTLRE